MIKGQTLPLSSRVPHLYIGLLSHIFLVRLTLKECSLALMSMKVTWDYKNEHEGEMKS